MVSREDLPADGETAIYDYRCPETAAQLFLNKGSVTGFAPDDIFHHDKTRVAVSLQKSVNLWAGFRTVFFGGREPKLNIEPSGSKLEQDLAFDDKIAGQPVPLVRLSDQRLVNLIP